MTKNVKRALALLLALAVALASLISMLPHLYGG